MAKQISLKDIMTKNIITATKTQSVQEIALKMKENNIGVIVITDPKGLVEGIISEKDILTKVVCAGIDSKTTLAKDVMTTKVITGKPTMTDVEVAALFEKYGVKKLPIIENNKVIGMVTRTDLLKLLSIKWAL